MVTMEYMEHALSLARISIGHVSPNPAVGAVIVRDDKIVGEGYTQPPPGMHAEIVAVKNAGDKSKKATMYVTLEPCAHYGRTSPCADAIIAAGITEVHIATLDDNPLVRGRGVSKLEEAGLRVVVGECEEEARQINECYIKYITTGLPFITVKYAMSVDGKMATRSGDSKWISNDDSRNFSHNLRYVSDAIMVGVNTVLIDDPHLTARSGHGHGGAFKKQPVRVIVDDAGRTPLSANIFKNPGKTIVLLGRKAKESEKTAFMEASDAELVEMPAEGGLVDLRSSMEYLAERGITSIMVEGGSMILGSMFDLGLVDKVLAFVAPIVIGGSGAKTPVAGFGADRVMSAIKLDRVSVTTFGEDTLITGYVKKD